MGAHDDRLPMPTSKRYRGQAGGQEDGPQRCDDLATDSSRAFPQPLKISRGCTVWLEHEIDELLEEGGTASHRLTSGIGVVTRQGPAAGECLDRARSVSSATRTVVRGRSGRRQNCLPTTASTGTQVLVALWMQRCASRLTPRSIIRARRKRSQQRLTAMDRSCSFSAEIIAMVLDGMTVAVMVGWHAVRGRMTTPCLRCPSTKPLPANRSSNVSPVARRPRVIAALQKRGLWASSRGRTQPDKAGSSLLNAEPSERRGRPNIVAGPLL